MRGIVRPTLLAGAKTFAGSGSKSLTRLDERRPRRRRAAETRARTSSVPSAAKTSPSLVGVADAQALRSGSSVTKLDLDGQPGAVSSPVYGRDFSVVLGEADRFELRERLHERAHSPKVDSPGVGAGLIDPFGLSLGGRRSGA